MEWYLYIPDNSFLYSGTVILMSGLKDFTYWNIPLVFLSVFRAGNFGVFHHSYFFKNLFCPSEQFVFVFEFGFDIFGDFVFNFIEQNSSQGVFEIRTIKSPLTLKCHYYNNSRTDWFRTSGHWSANRAFHKSQTYQFKFTNHVNNTIIVLINSHQVKANHNQCCPWQILSKITINQSHVFSTNVLVYK